MAVLLSVAGGGTERALANQAELVHAPGTTSGWLLNDGTRQWLSATCRTQLEQGGNAFTPRAWDAFARLPRATTPVTCDEIQQLVQGGPSSGSGATFVTNSPGNSAGWALIGGTKQWINATCRNQLTNAGATFSITPWSTISTTPDTTTNRTCTQLQTLITNAGETGGDGNGGGSTDGNGGGGGNGVPALSVTTIATGLSHPWDMEFTPDGTLLYTQRGGTLGVRLPNGVNRQLQATTSDILAERLTGMMGLAVDPNFASNRRFYTCQTNLQKQGEVVSWTVNAAYTVASRVQDPLVTGLEHSSTVHVGCRITVGPDGYLWITTGDNNTVFAPQSLNSTAGKVLRVDRFSGQGAPGNPYSSSTNPKTRMIFTFGHRNPQGIAFHPAGDQPYLIEHGPDADDEINRLVSGGNYGWQPGPQYDQNQPMTNFGLFPNARAASWTSGRPTVAPGGGDFIVGANWGALNGTLAVAMLKEEGLWFFAFDTAGSYGGNYIAPELDGTYGRIRHAEMGPDGSLYLATTNGSGTDKILKVTPLP